MKRRPLPLCLQQFRDFICQGRSSLSSLYSDLSVSETTMSILDIFYDDQDFETILQDGDPG